MAADDDNDNIVNNNGAHRLDSHQDEAHVMSASTTTANTTLGTDNDMRPSPPLSVESERRRREPRKTFGGRASRAPIPGLARHPSAFDRDGGHGHRRLLPSLHLRLLKERLELEVALRREGFRLAVFACFVCCLCASVAIFTDTVGRNESRSLIQQGLQLDAVAGAQLPSDIHRTMNALSRAARQFTLLSSRYVDDTLATTLLNEVQSFPEGALHVGSASQPQLRLEWALTAWLGFQARQPPSPRKSLLVKKYLPRDHSRLSCWAWYAKGPTSFVLEYGRHSLDEGYVSLPLEVNEPGDGGAPGAEDGEMRLSALVLNQTHATVYQQARGGYLSTSVSLKRGIPTDCEGGSLEVGSAGLLLAEVKFHPKQLTPQQFSEILDGGQTLEEIATGMAPRPAPELQLLHISEADQSTQDLVRETGASQLALGKVLGNMLTAATATTPTNSDRNGSASTITTTAADSTDDAVESTEATPAPESYISVVGAEGAAVVRFDPATQTWVTVPLDLGPVFRQVSEMRPTGDGNSNFTLAWWARAERYREDLREFVFAAPDGTPRLEVYYEEGRPYEGVGGWTFSFHGSPWCWDDSGRLLGAASPCPASPSWWCQAPSGNKAGTYDGIWRHFAVRFTVNTNHPDSARASLDLFQDGKLLCGAAFPLRGEVALPQGSLDSPSSVLFGTYGVGGGDPPGHEEMLEESEFLVKDARLYPQSLDVSTLRAMGLNSTMRECLNLETARDDRSFRTHFGLSCTDLAALAVGSQPVAPEACSAGDFASGTMRHCPVSCLHAGPPTCWDRTPQLLSPDLLPEPMPPVTSLYSAPRRPLAELYPAPTSAAQEGLVGLLSWSDGSDGAWVQVLESVEVVEAATVLFARGADRDGPNWLPRPPSAASTTPTNWWAAISCLPENHVAWLDNDQLKIEVNVCEAEKGWRDKRAAASESGQPLGSFADGGDEAVDDNGEDDGDFPAGMLAAGSSFSLWFWARAADTQDGESPSLAAIDADHNVCFYIEGYDFYMPARAPHQSIPLELELPRDVIQPNTWTFFAVSVDAARGLIIYTVNDEYIEISVPELREGLWGCNGMKHLLNTGSGIKLSPLRMTSAALLPGSIQVLYLRLAPEYSAIVTGPAVGRDAMGARRNRPRTEFPFRTVAIAPPLALQRRANTSSADLSCTGGSAEALNAAFSRSRAMQCKAPYSCEDDDSDIRMLCVGNVDNSTADKFMGQTGIAFRGSVFFPEFMWVLENNILVRDSKAFTPASDYIGVGTLAVVNTFVFITPESNIATMVDVVFDLSRPRLHTWYTVSQLKMLGSDETGVWLGWAIATTLFAFISMCLAVPAGWQEAKDKYRYVWLRHSPREVQRMRVERDRYTQNTSQPDLADVIFCLGLVIFMLYFIYFVTVNIGGGADIFAQIVDIDWASTKPFFTKTQTFLEALESASDLVKAADALRVGIFWVLVACCIRVIIYLKVHPAIAGCTRTFEICFWELVNFFFSFGVIFVFLAFIAYTQFGGLYDEFATMTAAMVTQFSILIGYSVPDYGSDKTLFIYIVGYVFICTLALLNFLLAIVVAGYDSAREQVLENKVAVSFWADSWCVLRDRLRWLRHPGWPSKVALLNEMAREYPDVFEETESPDSLNLSAFAHLLSKVSENIRQRAVANTKKTAPVTTTTEDAATLFHHYFAYSFLRAEETRPAAEGVDATAEGDDGGCNVDLQPEILLDLRQAAADGAVISKAGRRIGVGQQRGSTDEA